MATELRWILLVVGVLILWYLVWDARRTKKNNLNINELDLSQPDPNMEDALFHPKVQSNNYDSGDRFERGEPQIEEDADTRDHEGIESPVRQVNTQEVHDTFIDQVESQIPNDSIKQSRVLKTEVQPVNTEANARSQQQSEVISPSPKTSSKSKQPETNEPELVISINLMAEMNEEYQGVILNQSLNNAGYHIDYRGIYKRFEAKDGSGEYWFSLANAFNPGFFDLDTLDEFSTLGITFFMVLPGPHQPMKAFDAMLKDAVALQDILGGQLQDATHSVLSQQSIQYYRDQILQYQHRKASKETL